MKFQKLFIIPWYYMLVFLFIAGEAALFFILGEDIYVSMHDNLDLHVADYHILSFTNTFFSHNVQLPLLNGIDRDYFASEYSLYSLLYILFPTATAYVVGYLLKTVIAVISCVLLAKDVLADNYKQYAPVVVLCSFAYGILPLYPTFSFPFVSLPFVILLLRRIYKKPGVTAYFLLFLYPLLSYFTFFGFFILAYLFLAIILLWIKNKKLSLSLTGAFCVLFAGFALWEYRLFGIMLFDTTPTIRETMVQGNYNYAEILSAIKEAFTIGVFHAEAVHTWFVLPICIIYFLLLNYRYIKERDYKGIWTDIFNWIIAFLVFNSIIYGLYYQEYFRSFIEMLIPPLKGFQFSRTVFFNPFLWYLALFIILKRLYDNHKQKTVHVIVLMSIAVILLTGSKYNDLYHTAFNYAYRIIKQQPSNSLTYKEFYSENLFHSILSDIDYSGEKSVAYGMHPAVLEYNRIFTLDGCLSYYPQEYKEQFREIISPALDRVESFRIYYDHWGARAYLFGGVDENVYEPVRNLEISDTNLYINADAFKKMEGKYIFSRIKITNEDELKLHLRGTYTDVSSPYTIYLYEAN
ncbi:hypothetical protein EDD76_1094 [Kineothrix alysoides]|uniref:Uncharacterized protein n=1 Tax=Kineothrix alysoides TaxID=1469948 RepID=A0A4V2QBT4_9FIRM|nr:DUF6044 family protein [Kineothrix alysoides]TCL57142.1 hypothetical protein EDD76_1094 [Kineothrix alysoides]